MWCAGGRRARGGLHAGRQAGGHRQGRSHSTPATCERCWRRATFLQSFASEINLLTTIFRFRDQSVDDIV
jgi:hypothetical protein